MCFEFILKYLSSIDPSFSIKRKFDLSPKAPPWDKVNSHELINNARRIYIEYLSSASIKANPIGIVINKRTNSGKPVFKVPTLLPNELFLKLKYIAPKSSKRY